MEQWRDSRSDNIITDQHCVCMFMCVIRLMVKSKSRNILPF